MNKLQTIIRDQNDKRQQAQDAEHREREQRQQLQLQQKRQALASLLGVDISQIVLPEQTVILERDIEESHESLAQISQQQPLTYQEEEEEQGPALIYQRVRVKGIVDNDHARLNGLLGTVHRFDFGTGLYSVHLDIEPDTALMLPAENLEGRGRAAEFNISYSRPTSSWSGIRDRVEFPGNPPVDLVQVRLSTAGSFRRRQKKDASAREDHLTTDVSLHGSLSASSENLEGAENIWPPSLPSERWKARDEVMEQVKIDPRVAASVFREALRTKPFNSNWAALKRKAGAEVVVLSMLFLTNDFMQAFSLLSCAGRLSTGIGTTRSGIRIYSHDQINEVLSLRVFTQNIRYTSLACQSQSDTVNNARWFDGVHPSLSDTIKMHVDNMVWTLNAGQRQAMTGHSGPA